jgi:hypothetical protein
MPRSRQIEEILEAWYDLDHCAPAHKAEAKRQLFTLLQAAIGDRPLTPEQLLEYLWPRYSEFRAARRKAEKLRIVQSALRK